MLLLRTMITEAMNHPGAFQRLDGNGDVVQHIPEVPASTRAISIHNSTPLASAVRAVSAPEMRSVRLVNDNQRSAFLPAGTDAGKQTMLSAGVLDNSLVAKAGARIVIVPSVTQTPDVAQPGSKPAYKFSMHPAAFVTVEAGAMTVVEDGEDVPISMLPLHTIEFSEEAPTVGVRFQLTRRQLKGLSDEVTTDAIWTAIGLGLANAADNVLLTALNSAALGQFTLGNVAARGLRFAELSAVVGTNAAVTAEVAADGVLRTRGVPAELTNAIAGTIIGAFTRAAVAIREDIRITALRTNDGGCQVTCFASMEAVVPDATAFWKAV
jgi:hypothetical protein